MVRGLIVFLISLTLVMGLATPSFAQANESASMSRTGGPRKQVATIVFAGLAGAILGLSTLSFYGRPQDKLTNIAYGFAIGVFIGATYTTYRAATPPRPNGEPLPDAYNLRRAEPEYLRLADARDRTAVAPTWKTGWSWEF